MLKVNSIHHALIYYLLGVPLVCPNSPSLTELVGFSNCSPLIRIIHECINQSSGDNPRTSVRRVS